jgi:GR25 family glycosyltransferase involved in LPS biosynthesis
MKTFIITLSKIPASLKTATAMIAPLTSFGLDVTLFEGSYGDETKTLFEKEGRVIHPFSHTTEQIDQELLDKVAAILPMPEHQRYKISITRRAKLSEQDILAISRPGVIGCFWSHYRLWQKCVELDEPIFIFEDDVVFKREYIPVEFKDVLVVATGKKLYRTALQEMFENPQGEVEAKSWWRIPMPGAVGYAIKPHAAKKLLETYKTTYLPADNAINSFEVNIEIHSHLMGRAAEEEDGKRSLTKLDNWINLRKHMPSFP